MEENIVDAFCESLSARLRAKIGVICVEFVIVIEYTGCPGFPKWFGYAVFVDTKSLYHLERPAQGSFV